MRFAPLVVLALACSGDDGKTDTGTDTDTDTDTSEHTGATTNPNDRDGDGVAAPIDCDDTDPLVYPGAPEHCDGEDSDCDGFPDLQIVTVLPDRSFPSLAEAAAAAGDGDTLVVCPGTYTGSSVVSASVTIRPLDPSDRPVLDGQGSGTTLVIDALDVRVESMRIIGGTASGVLSTLDGSVTLVDCVVEDNIGRFGGGVQLSLLGGTLEDCVIADNVAQDDGGGLYANGTTVVTRTTLTGNVASGWGGGIAVGAGSEAVLTDVDVSGNTAERGGGLFALEDTVVEALGSTAVHDNTASQSGGGVYLWTTTWTGGSVNGNDAVVSGGGIYVYDGGSVTDVEIRLNRADQGGGMLLRGSPALEGVLVEANQGDSLAGGIYLLDADVTSTDVDVMGNSAPAGGGAVLQDSSWAGATLTGNTADNGGGIYLANVDDAFVGTLDGLLVEDNESTTSGGGMYVLDDVDIVDSSISRNISQDRAGGIYVSNGAETQLLRTFVVSNGAVERGGGLYSNDGAVVELTESDLSRNQALRGAGIYINGASTVELKDCTVHGNGDPTTVSGGGARVTDGDLVSVTSDWGTGIDENAPDDVYAEAVGAYIGYGIATFACDVLGCAPEP